MIEEPSWYITDDPSKNIIRCYLAIHWHWLLKLSFHYDYFRLHYMKFDIKIMTFKWASDLSMDGGSSNCSHGAGTCGHPVKPRRGIGTETREMNNVFPYSMASSLVPVWWFSFRFMILKWHWVCLFGIVDRNLNCFLAFIHTFYKLLKFCLSLLSQMISLWNNLYIRSTLFCHNPYT